MAEARSGAGGGRPGHALCLLTLLPRATDATGASPRGKEEGERARMRTAAGGRRGT